MKSLPSVGVALVTLNAQAHLPHNLPLLAQSALKPHLLVVDSSSTDATVSLAKEMGAEVLTIPRKEFNHGTTRELARKHLGTEIVVMMTQDAYPANSQTLDLLVAPLIQKQASLAYARQIPHHGASLLAAFARFFNYPETSHIRRWADRAQYGVYTIFCSNSCAAYSNAALDQIGGFKPVLLGEDTEATAALLQQGHRIAYVAEAEVHHSHDYNLWQEFCRSFDTGLVRRGYIYLSACSEQDRGRGYAYVKELTRYLWQHAPHQLPYAYLHTLCKWGGYEIGRRSVKAPRWWKQRLSSQPHFWDSPHAF